MRNFASILVMLGVIALGYWAYHQTILTQQSVRHIEYLQRSIGAERERLAILRAEWAYLNRPDRLRELADLNFDRLGLLPLEPGNFGTAADIPYPLPEWERDVDVLDSASVAEGADDL